MTAARAILLPYSGDLVLGLILKRYPLAILWVVSLVNVYALEGIAGRAWTKIGNKLPRVFLPFLANLYPSASIVLKSLVSRVFAPPYGIVERLDRAGAVWIFCEPMSCLARRKQFFLQAPATLNSPSSELPTVMPALIAAITEAKPNNVPSWCSAILPKDGQPSDPLARSINWKCH